MVVLLHAAHHVLLTRSLFYTAVTRARRLAVVIGDPKAIARAARTTGDTHSYCHLAERLRDAP